jgi:cellulose synthase operon protein C
MRTLNVRRLVVLLVVIGVLAGSTHLLHSFQIQRKSSTFKIQARDAWEKSKTAEDDNSRREYQERALTMMRNYLVFEPDDLEARQDRGMWLVETGSFRPAAPILEEVVRSLERQTPQDLPRLQTVRRSLAEAYNRTGRWIDALDHLKILNQELPDDVDILASTGRCLVALGREDGEEGAIAKFSQAVKKDPKRVDLYYCKAMALLYPKISHPLESRQPEAEKCMAEMIAYWDSPPPSRLGNSPSEAARRADKGQSATAHHTYALWLDDLDKHAEALKQSEKTLELVPDHPGALYLVGKSELALGLSYMLSKNGLGGRGVNGADGLIAKAEASARRGIEVSPKNAAMYMLLADVHIAQNQRDKAIEVLKRGVDAMPTAAEKANILWNLANLYLDGRSRDDAPPVRVDGIIHLNGRQEIAAAVDCMNRMRGYLPPEKMAFLDARLLYANDNWKEALEGFEKVRPSLRESPRVMKDLDYWTGYCYVQQGNPDQAKVAYHFALTWDKYFFKARDGIAQIYISNGEYRNAALEYSEVLKGDPRNFDAVLALGRTLVNWNLHRTSGQNWDQVDAVLARAQQLNPRDGRVLQLKAEMLAAQGKTKEAEWWLEQIHLENPNSAEGWVAKANLAARQGRIDQARQILEEAKAKLGDQVVLRLAQSVFFVREMGVEAGPEIEKLAGGADAFSRDEKTRLWNGLVKNLLDIREYDRAKQICKQIARAQPTDAMIRYRLLELALATHNARDPVASLAELDGVLNELDHIAGRGPLWLYGKAVRLMLESGGEKTELLDEAMKYADLAQKARLNWSRPDVLKGEICRQQHKDEDALHYYLQASINGDQDPEFIRLLLRMLFERQRYREADQVIRNLENNQAVVDADIKSTEAQIFNRYGSFDKALESTRSAFDSKSGDYREHVLHGQLLAHLARRAQQEGHAEKMPKIIEEGEKSLLRACAIARNAPEARVVLVQFLVATNQLDKARKAARDAEDMIQSYPLALAYIYEAVGQPQDARRNYEKAVRTNPDSPRSVRMLAEFYIRNHEMKLANPLIDRLLSSGMQASESDLAAARRMKADSLSKEGYPKLKEALELVDRNLVSPQAAIEDKRLKIRLLVSDLRQARGSDVLELSKSIVETGGAEPEPEDRLTLARLYLARGNWKGCQEQMQKLVNGSQSNPRFVSEYVRMLIDHDELQDAEILLEQLGRVSKPTQTVSLQAELLFRKKEWARVPDLLADYVRQATTNAGQKSPDEELARMLLAAQLLEDLGGRLTAHKERALSQRYFDAAAHWYEAYSAKRKQSELVLAAFYARHGKLSAALELLTRSGASAPPRDLFYAAATIIRREDIKPQDLLVVEKVLAARPTTKDKSSVPVLNALIVLRIAQGKFAEAEDLCRQILAQDPNSYLACNNLAVLLALSPDSARAAGGAKLDEALALVNRAIDLAGPLPLLLDSRAVVRMARKEAQAALEDLASITAGSSSTSNGEIGKPADKGITDKIDPVWLYHKARALFLAGQFDESASTMEEARNKGLDRSLVDPPERPLFDQLQEQLVKHEDQP